MAEGIYNSAAYLFYSILFLYIMLIINSLVPASSLLDRPGVHFLGMSELYLKRSRICHLLLVSNKLGKLDAFSNGYALPYFIP